MSYLPRVDAAPTAEWPDLVAEFDRWSEAGRTAVLWWRDDDAVTATPQLASLLRRASGVPLALAVIPAMARSELTSAMRRHPDVSVLQHGWRHVNRAGQRRKSEYPQGRPAAQVTAEIAAGRARLRALFGERSLPVFVPPWNRIADEFLPLLSESGFAGVSAMASRRVPALPSGLTCIDAHIDLVAWRRDRGFVGETAALAALLAHLRARRLDPALPPVAILTHHLVMDHAGAAFLDRLVPLTHAHAGVRWAAVSELLQ